MTLVAGLAMPLGGVISNYTHFNSQLLEEKINHFLVGFGGGALLSAVALVLVPEGLKNLNSLYVAASFISGGVAFMWLDSYQASKGASASQLTAMLTDFVPEALALGALFSVSRESGAILAFIIFLQNLPEGYNAFKELAKSHKYSKNAILLVLLMLVFLGPMSGVFGLLVLAEHFALLSAIMLFAAGGIIYTTFQNIAPLTRLAHHRFPSLGAVFGFSLGMLGHLIIHG